MTNKLNAKTIAVMAIMTAVVTVFTRAVSVPVPGTVTSCQFTLP